MGKTYVTGQVIEEADTNGWAQLVDLAASGGAGLLGYSQGASGSVSRTVAAKLAESVSVLDFGADPTGVADSTAAIQAAINAAQATNKRLYIPAASNCYLVTAPLIITAGLTICGDFVSPYTPSDFNTRGPGSWLYFNHLGKGFDIENASADVTTVTLEGIGTIRNQPAPAAGWAPVAADYDIYIGNADVHVRDVMLWNPTKGIQINSASGARVDIQGLYGQPLQIGIDCYLAEDVCRIRNVHFWPYWDNDTAYVIPYMWANFIPLQLERCDNPMISDFFAIYALYGINFTHNSNGYTQRAQLSNIGIDTFGSNAINIAAGADGTSFQVSNLYGYSGTNATNGINCAANNCIIQASNVRFSQLGYSASSINGSGNIAKYSDWIVDGYNGANNSSVCFYTNSGCRTEIADAPHVTATNASPLISGTAALSSVGAIVASGSATLSGTSVVVTHGLGWAPLWTQINLHPYSAPPAPLYVSAVTSTTFTVNSAVSGNCGFNWTIDGWS